MEIASAEACMGSRSCGVVWWIRHRIKISFLPISSNPAPISVIDPPNDVIFKYARGHNTFNTMYTLSFQPNP